MFKPFGVILSISANPAVSETRRLVLQQRGFLVAVATNLLEVEQKCKDHSVVCAIVGSDIDPQMKRAVAQVIGNVCPTTPVLEVIRVSPEIEGASTVQSDAPDALLAAVDDLLRPSGLRYSQQLHRKVRTVQKISQETVLTARETRERIKKLKSTRDFSALSKKR